MSSDNEIIQQSRENPATFSQLYDRHHQRIYRFATSRIGSSAADDVMSETFLVAFERRSEFRTDSENATAWLYGIANTLLKKHARLEARAWKGLAADHAAAVDRDAIGAAESRIDAEVESRRLGLMLKRMPRADRDTLLLYAWTDLGYEGVAQALDVPVGTVRSRLNRVRHEAARGNSEGSGPWHGGTAMDELTLLRSIHDDAPEASEEASVRGRAALFQKIAEEVEPMKSTEKSKGLVRRTRVRRVGFASLGMAALAAGLVMTNVLGFAGLRGGADSAAAAVLHQAALNTTDLSDPVVGAGQYLKIDTASVNLASSPKPGGGGNVSYLFRDDEQVYVPADRDDDWVWIRPVSKPYAFFGTDSEQVAKADYAQELAASGDGVEKVRAPGGNWYGGESDISVEALAALPKDGHQLLNYIYRTTLGAESPRTTKPSCTSSTGCARESFLRMFGPLSTRPQR